LGFAGDETGRKVQLKFRGKTVSLYDFWDKTISETIRTDESNYWLSGWTHVRQVMSEFKTDKELWAAEGAFKMFERWAAETVQFACQQAYILPSSGKKLAGSEATLGDAPVDVTEEDYSAWRTAWMRQVLLAGERTAIVLNDILDDSNVNRLHEGTAVQTNADKEQEELKKQWAKERESERRLEAKRTSGASINFTVLMTNLSIAAVVVPLFLLVANHGMNVGKWVSLAKVMLDGSNGNGTLGSGGRSSAKRWE